METMTPDGASNPPEETARGPNLLVRIGQVFFSPGALFEALRARPVWIDVMILLLIASAASQMLLPEERFRELFMQQMPPDTDPADAEQIMGFMRRWGIGVAVIWLPIATAVVAGMISLAFNVVMGGEARFRELYSAVVHAFVILTVGGFVVLGLLLMGGEQVVLSPALILPDMGNGYLARFLARINVFAVWTCIVLGIAVSKLYSGRSAFGGAMYLLVLYGIIVGASAIAGG
ncbi:MAG: YIP1 family protein [Gemmatimonadota bacterium]|nr:YIP1 family protein [Gemmatimonadota bacterium]